MPLPFITKLLIAVGAFAKSYGLIMLGLVVVAVLVVRQLRKRPDFAYKMDATILQMRRCSAIGCATSPCCN